MKKIKVGIWGVGRAGYGMHLPDLEKKTKMFEIVACCDILEDHCEALAEKVPGIKTYNDSKDFLGDTNIDLVTIATRSPDHTAHAIQALEAGKYVFLEKPIALNYDDALKLQKISKLYPGKLFCRHNRRFEPAFVHIREIIAAGMIGELYEVKLRRHGYQRRNDWQTIIKCGGGQLNNWGPHIIEHALRFIDSPVVDIWSDLKKIAAVGDAEDHLKIILKGESNIIVDLEISGGVAIPEPEYIIFGTKGALTCDGKEITLKYLDPKQKLGKIEALSDTPPIKGDFGNNETLEWIEETIKVAPSDDAECEDIWKHLYSTIRNGEIYPITIEEAIEVVRVTEIVKKNSNF